MKLRFNSHLVSLFALGAVVLLGCARSPQMVPPVVVLRDIANMERIASGEVIDFTETTCLFVPDGWTAAPNGEVTLTMHFHDAAWFAMEEHARRGATNPLFVFGGLQGSSAYREPYLDSSHFADQIREVEDTLRERFGVTNAHVTHIEIQSFSAGYGAVREILKSSEYVDLIDTIVLADSMYASFRSDEDHRALPEHVESFVEFARLANEGRKTFLVVHASGLSPSYATTTECARAMLEEIGAEEEPVAPGSLPSADPSLEYRLISRYDHNSLHVWGYAGDTPEAHMAMARALADYWREIDGTAIHGE